MPAACIPCSAPSFLAVVQRSRRPSSHRRALAGALSCPSSAARLNAASSSFVVDPCRSASSLALVLPFSQRHRPAPRSKAISAEFERFDKPAGQAVEQSQREADGLGAKMVFNQHLVLGLVAVDDSPDGFLGSGITIARARETACILWDAERGASYTGPSPTAVDVPFSESTKRVFKAAIKFSESRGFREVTTEHLVIGLYHADDGLATLLFESLGTKLVQLARVAYRRMKRDEQAGPSTKIIRQRPLPKHKAERDDNSTIAQFCVDLTARANEGLVDPVIGRDKEIERIIEILCRRTKSNPILLGDAGVGKTAIVEGLALRAAEGDVPLFLMGKRILSLDVGSLMAGTKERGELEARVTALIREVKNSGDIILFVDEAHTLINTGIAGRGNKSSGLDIANLLKPSLSRGGMQCIASTTLDEYRLHFEKDKALARRFQPVLIGEPSLEDTVKILFGIKEIYEDHHNCRFTLEALNAAVYLSARYIPDRHLPDKAIDVIDEAGSGARIGQFKKLKAIWAQIIGLLADDQMISGDDNKGTEDLQREPGLMPSKIDSPSSSPDYEDRVVVGPEEIAAVISLWTGIPVRQLEAVEIELLVHLEEELKKRVVGQDDAVGVISRAMKRSRLGLRDPKRPICVLLFCGPTGVGKSELTKALAASYFGSEKAMVRLDMSEYMEKHTVSKLIGSPPGYVGYGEGGTLTEAVRRKPYSIVLLDEIEKAHRDIFNILLQVFEDGHLTDSGGRRISFRNTLIVMTSNVGSEAISKGKRSFGFLPNLDCESNTRSYDAMKKLVMEELQEIFLPEILNRVDEVVVFRSLEKAQLLDILDIMLCQVKKRLKLLEIDLEVSDAAKELICRRGFDRSYGARPLRREVTRLVEDAITEAILSGECKTGDALALDVDGATGNPTVRRLRDDTLDVDATE